MASAQVRRPGTYTADDAAKAVGVPTGVVRALARAKVLHPLRDGRSLLYSFSDLVLLRAAKALIDSEVSSRRVVGALRKLHQRLPTGRPLTSLTLRAEGDQVIVIDGKHRFVAESGQGLLDFSSKRSPTRVLVLERPPKDEGASTPDSKDISIKELANKVAPLHLLDHKRATQRASSMQAEEWFELGSAVEVSDLERARDAYRRAIELQPDHGPAHLNLGRLLHEEGQLQAAIAHYRLAATSNGAVAADPVLAQFNLGVALADHGDLQAAKQAYLAAVALDPSHEDAHYNLAAVLEQLGDKVQALRYLRRYQELLRKR